MKPMKYSGIIILLLFIFACSPQEKEPTDVAGMKDLVKEKKTQLRDLQKEIDKLQSEIEVIEPSKEKKRTSVTVEQLKKKNFKRFVEVQGTVQSSDAVFASSETGGRIVSLTVDEGDYVTQGQVIGRVDMEAVNKQIAELDKSLELAQDLFVRQERLWKQNIGSEVQFLQAKNNKERLEKSLESIRFQLTKANISSPLTGVVDRLFVKAGEMTSPGAPVVQIINNARVKVIADLPENYLGVIKQGEYVDVYFPSLDLEKRARVSQLGRSIDPANRTFSVEIELNNPGGRLKPFLLATMKVNDLLIKDVVVIPLETVQQEVSGKKYVYIVEKGENGDQSKKIYVKTGDDYEGVVVIEEGLLGNEQLVLVGARGLANEDLLTIESTSNE